MNQTIEQHINHIEQEIIENRRYLHQHPELSREETETSRFVQEKLAEYGISVQTGFAGTGVLGIINGKYSGKTVALRADMDALPIQEQTDHSFASQHDGKMHACGHDAHTAMLLGAGYTLQHMRDYIQGTVLLVFQPAEEDAPVGGAQAMMDDGVFSEYVPDVIYAQHVWPSLPVGEIGIRDHEMMGASDRFTITIKGKGGHASMPQQGNDAIMISSHILTSLQTIVSRNVNPLDSAVVTVGTIHGGYRYNVIADQVVLEGTVRTYKQEVKSRVKERFYTLVEQTAAAFEGEVEIEYLDGYPATVNSPEWAENARHSAEELFGEASTPEVDPALAGEDFARFLEHYPGAFIWLGTQIEDKDEQMGLHDPGFKLNEAALPKGSALFAKLALDALDQLAKGGDDD
ncbi:M20 family metallopeptidase [Thalassobacillus sp. CUG 92003]|uniref:M20 metallopeptidase family protein n=1 Tax=Thalassobacillus sp. CUG 92003 TaxID=2736641 RepID=UPI0015E75632|nr:M20 family metallopeptidase [Thalassobacillus sp. CUG 92003]